MSSCVGSCSRTVYSIRFSCRFSTTDRTQSGPSESSSAATDPEHAASAPSRHAPSLWPCAFFSPGLCPMLQGGTGHKHAGSTPQRPTGGAGRHTLFHHETHGHLDHPTGVMTTRERQIRQSDSEIFPASQTRVRRVGHQKIHGTSGSSITQVMERALASFVTRGAMTTARAGGGGMVPVVHHQGWCWEVVDINNALGRVWHVVPWSTHGVLPSEKRLGAVV